MTVGSLLNLLILVLLLYSGRCAHISFTAAKFLSSIFPLCDAELHSVKVTGRLVNDNMVSLVVLS